MKINFNKARFISCAMNAEGFPVLNLPEVAFVGRSNVGKSTLINCLTRRKGLAKTSRTPGKTTTAVFFDVEEKMRLVDLPGYGFAQRSVAEREKWQHLAEAYFVSRECLKATVVIMDIRHAPTPLDESLIEWLDQLSINVIPVLNKADKLSRNKQIKRENEIRRALGWSKKQKIIVFSALNGTGIKELEKAVVKAAFSQ